MNVIYTKKFEKRFALLSVKVQDRFFERLELFLKNPHHPQIKNHPLKGHLLGYRAFSVTGDVRAIFRYNGLNEIKLIDIGTHNQVH